MICPSSISGLDVLVNNAGIVRRETLANMTCKSFETSMNVNVRSALLLTQAAVKYLECSSVKAVVNVSSIAGLRAYLGTLGYKMSKAAMDQMTRCNALELAEKGIRVNSVNPGVIDTDIFNRSGMSEKEVEDYFEKCKILHPIGRIGKPIEVAKCIAFLASTDASFVCGQTLAVDGGRSIQCP